MGGRQLPPPGVTFLYQCGIITGGSPLLQYDSWSSDQGRTIAGHRTSNFLPGVFVMKCFILLYGSHSVSVLGVYISSVRGNPIKVSPRLEIHEKMRNILTIPPHSRRLERGPMWSPSHGVQTLLTKNQVNNLYENRQSPDDQTQWGCVCYRGLCQLLNVRPHDSMSSEHCTGR